MAPPGCIVSAPALPACGHLELPRWSSASLAPPPVAARPALTVVDDRVPVDCPRNCSAPCNLADCARGSEAIVVRVDCGAAEASRLRSLGVYEGARVRVLDDRHALLLRVHGARLAIGRTIAAAITVGTALRA